MSKSFLIFLNIFFLITITLFSCDFGKTKTKIIVQKEAIELAKLENKGKIKHDQEVKDAVLVLMEEDYIQQFSEVGFDYRIKEHIEAWRAYKDGEYIILTGSVCKNEEICAIFIEVYQDGESVFFEFVNNKLGTYPKSTIPYKI